MQIKKALTNDCLRGAKCSETFIFQIFLILQYLYREICFFLKKVAHFLTDSIVFCVYK